MTVSKTYLLAQAAKRKQATTIARSRDRDLPPLVKPSIWNAARGAYFGAQPLTAKQLLESQLAAQGLE